MDDLTRERYGVLPVREKPRQTEDEKKIAERRKELALALKGGRGRRAA